MRKAITVICGLFMACTAAAQGEYPSRPIRFVSITSAGSGGDAILRMVTDKMAPLVKGTFYIEPKTGASGAIATDFVAKAPADGHTLLFGGFTSQILLASVNPKLSYNPDRDFIPIGRIGTASILLVSSNDFPANNLRDFIAYAKTKPNLQYASWGNASTGHFCAELLNQKKGITLSHIPYKAMAQVVTDMLGGTINLAFLDMATGSPLVKAGRLKALGACTARTPSLPDVMSYEDEGINFEGKTVAPPLWAMYAPANTPRPIVDKLAAALKTVVEMPEVKAKLLDGGVTPAFLGPDELRVVNRASVEAWREIGKKANITMN